MSVDADIPPQVLAEQRAEQDQTLMRRRRPKITLRVAALNITSMLDLTFNLLLFFVLTANFVVSEGSLPANLPAGTGGGADASIAASDPEPPENPLVISLRSLGGGQVGIFIEGANVSASSFEDLHTRLRLWQHNAGNPSGSFKPDNPISIRPDAGVSWSDVVDCFNAVVRARYTNVSFAPVANRAAND